MHQKTGTIEKRSFINHTECFCEDKANVKTSRPEPMRRATVISCTCTKAFEQVLEEDGTCRCDCSSSNYACDWKKKGREHFSMEDRKWVSITKMYSFRQFAKTKLFCHFSPHQMYTGGTMQSTNVWVRPLWQKARSLSEEGR